jgi:hypothetical protein
VPHRPAVPRALIRRCCGWPHIRPAPARPPRPRCWAAPGLILIAVTTLLASRLR